MKILTISLIILAFSSQVFALSSSAKESAVKSAEVAAVAVAKASQEVMGSDLSRLDIYAYDSEEVSRTDRYSTIKLKVGFDSGLGEKYIENYTVIINKFGHVKSVTFNE